MIQVRHVAMWLSLALLGLGLVVPRLSMAQVFPPMGPPFEVDPTSAIGGPPETTAVNLQGDHVVVWASRNAGNTATQIVGRLVSASTGLPVSATFAISPLVANTFDSSPEVASALDGTFVVTWSRITTGDPRILARRFQIVANVAAPLAPEFQVASTLEVTSFNSRTKVGVDLSGNMVFAWIGQCATRVFPTRTECATKFKGYRWDQTEVLSERFVIDTFGSSGGTGSTDTRLEAVAMAPTSGRFALLWKHTSASSNSNDPCRTEPYCMRVYDTLNSPIAPGGPLTQRFGAIGGEVSPGQMISVDLTTDFTGNFVLASGHITLDATSLRVRRFDRDGEELTAEFVAESSYFFDHFNHVRVSAANLNNHITLTFGRGTQFIKWLPSNYDQEDVLSVPTFQASDALGSVEKTASVAMALDGSILLAWMAVDGRALARRYQPPVEVRVNDTSVAEGTPNRATAAFTIQISRPHPNGAPISVNYLTEEGTATATVDYMPVNDVATFTGATVAQPVTVQVIDDANIEDDETYSLRLVNASNAVILDSRGIGTILNDDTGGVLLVRNAQRTEGNAGTQPMVFEVALDKSQGLPVTVSYVTSDESATAGSDYAASFGTLNFPGGFTSAFVTVDVFGDTAFEGDETFRLTLFDAVNATIGPALGNNAGRGTIVSDDLCAAPPTIDVTSVMVPVGGSTGSIAVTDAQDCGWTASTATPWITITSSPNCPPGSPANCAHGGTGSGTLDYAVAASIELSQRLGTLRVANTDVSVEQDGVTCNFTLDPGTAQYTSLGGNGQVTLLATDAACPWTATSLSPWITLTASPACPPGAPIGCAHGGTGNGTVSYVVDVNENVARTGNINVAQSLFGVDQLGFFFDDFDNGVVSPFWTNDPASGWTEMNSRLIGDFATGETGTTIARPAFAGCIECEITAKLRFDRFSQGSASVLAWYLDEFTHVELEANEFRNQWELRQVVNGAVVASSGVLSRPTVTGVDYTVELVFDGTEIALSIDGDLALLMPPAVGTTPDGTVGFKVTNNLVSFDLVKAVTGTESVALPRDVFADGFE